MSSNRSEGTPPALSAEAPGALERLPVAVALWDRGLRLRAANAAWRAMHRLSAENPVGAPLDQLLTADAVASDQPLIEATLAGERRTIERPSPAAGAEAERVAVQYLPDLEDGEVAGAFMIVAPAAAAGDRDEAQAQLEAMISAIPVAVWRGSDDDGSITEQWERISGQSTADCEAGRWSEVVHPDDRARVEAAWRRFCAGEAAFEEEYRILRADSGEERVVRDRGVHVDGIPGVQWVGTTEEVTEEVRAAREERSREALLQSVFAAMGEGIAVQDADARILSCNASAEAILGLSADQMMGRTSVDPRWRAVHEDGTDWPGETHPAMVTLATGEPQHDVIMGVHKPDGRLTWITINAEPLVIPGSERHGVVVTFADVTTRLEAERAARAAQARLEAVLEAVPSAVWSYAPDGVQASISERWTDLTGQTVDDWLRDDFEMIHPDDRERVAAAWRQLVDAGRPYTEQYRIRRADTGEQRTIFERALPVSGIEGIAVVGMSEDVTMLVKAEASARQLTAEQASLRRIAELVARRAEPAKVFAAVAMETGDIVRADAAGVIQFEQGRRGVLVGSWVAPGHPLPPTGSVIDLNEPSAVAMVWRSGAPARFEAHTVRHAAFPGFDERVSVPVRVSGRLWGALTVGMAERGFDEQVEERLTRFADLVSLAITDAEARATLRHLAFHDALTGIPNRERLLDRLGEALREAEQPGAGVAVICIGLDHFKFLNDTYGHARGDELLAAVASRLVATAGEGRTVARLGGDHFGVVAAGIDDPQAALALAEQLLACLADATTDGGLLAGATAGVVVRGAGDSADDALRDADTALYSAKADARGRPRAFDAEMRRQLLERRDVELELRDALERGEFRLAYQPTVSLADGSIRSVEALIRWQHPTRGLLAPDAFIPIAEETGLILPIGRWVISQACSDAAGWSASSAGGALDVNVNVSAAQLGDAGLHAHIQACLHQSGLEPGRLGLEITETVLLDETPIHIGRVHELKRLGLRLLLDDFGTGYSSLAYVQRFPLDTLKIDRTLVAEIDRSERDTAIVVAILQMARALELDVVAEGVETAADVAALAALDCRAGQGWFFARPLEAQAIAALLQQQPPWLGDERASVFGPR